MFYANLTSGIDGNLYSSIPLWKADNILEAVKLINEFNKDLINNHPRTTIFYKLFYKLCQKD